MDLNKGFYKWVKTGLPWVICKVAQSENRLMGIDNKSSIWITNDISKSILMNCGQELMLY